MGEGAKSGRAELADELAAAVRASLDRGDVADATSRVVRGHGPEILGYLVAMSRREIDAHDAFAQFCEDVWRGLAGFRWQASLRTWCYVVARNALRRQWGGAPERHGLHVSPSQVPELAAQVRTATAEYVRTETKSRFAALREQLEPDDRTLLILRVDRRMGWRDIAAVLGEPLDAAGLERRAAALRKRFERLKLELRAQLGASEA
ncbi:RNA polymerase sigma factor [Nannocystis radixulma]|uniref:Sigma-70 family RNA polymerase sigma factor n=1 Tax=Nannocystis radixulma TaxID=2995305 RepID=A0ABT5BBP6_9BACT|nr:sigma-70 family RNA polymerase sigma factor [Nannocystis radixulma]MDC0671559.1 sigma-70 family RNA polymerase sigma factor [Nannocystis radixulma]